MSKWEAMSPAESGPFFSNSSICRLTGSDRALKVSANAISFSPSKKYLEKSLNTIYPFHGGNVKAVLKTMRLCQIPLLSGKIWLPGCFSQMLQTKNLIEYISFQRVSCYNYSIKNMWQRRHGYPWRFLFFDARGCPGMRRARIISVFFGKRE